MKNIPVADSRFNKSQPIRRRNRAKVYAKVDGQCVISYRPSAVDCLQHLRRSTVAQKELQAKTTNKSNLWSMMLSKYSVDGARAMLISGQSKPTQASAVGSSFVHQLIRITYLDSVQFTLRDVLTQINVFTQCVAF